MSDKPEKETAPAEEKQKGKKGKQSGADKKTEKPPAEKSSSGHRRKRGGDK